jgi:hypothetical protein
MLGRERLAQTLDTKEIVRAAGTFGLPACRGECSARNRPAEAFPGMMASTFDDGRRTRSNGDEGVHSGGQA